MPIPKAVVFDLGKVLLDFDYSRAARNLAAHCSISEAEIRDLINQSPLLLRYESGLMSTTEFFEEVKRQANFTRECNDFEPMFADIFSPIPEMIELNSHLRSNDVPTYIFSNTNPIAISHIRQKYPFFSEFNDFVLSYEHGAMKPDPAIYAAVENRSGFSGDALLYVDDRAENIEQGNSRGWQTILHAEPTATIHRISELGLLK